MLTGFMMPTWTRKASFRCAVTHALIAGLVFAVPGISVAQSSADTRFPLPVLDASDERAERSPAIKPVEGSPPMPAPIGATAGSPDISKTSPSQVTAPGTEMVPGGQGGSVLSPSFVPPGESEANIEAGRVTASPEEIGPAVYYDSTTIPAATSMGAEAGPRKADPRKEPAQKLIVVSKDYGAGSIEAQIVAASRALELGRYDSAISMYEALKRRNSRDQRILMGLAVAYQKAGRTDAAIQAYQSIVDINPDNVDARANMLGLIRTKYPAVALRRLLDLREKEPNNATLAAQIGLTHAELGNFDEAMEYLGMASAISPGNPLHYYNMAVVADRAGHLDEARSLYERALEVDAIEGTVDFPRELVYDRLAKIRDL
ncbi:MAG: tetratricopeptide repeat protein [Alphaproteobacteria bacterium]|nr:tetratricopeptide repeat protein [Alphaproteobacteria bacterium]